MKYVKVILRKESLRQYEYDKESGLFAVTALQNRVLNQLHLLVVTVTFINDSVIEGVKRGSFQKRAAEIIINLKTIGKIC